jgi:hypothetical protein
LATDASLSRAIAPWVGRFPSIPRCAAFTWATSRKSAKSAPLHRPRRDEAVADVTARYPTLRCPVRGINTSRVDRYNSVTSSLPATNKGRIRCRKRFQLPRMSASPGAHWIGRSCRFARSRVPTQRSFANGRSASNGGSMVRATVGSRRTEVWRSERLPAGRSPPPGLVRFLHRAAGNSPVFFGRALGQAKRAESCSELQRGHTNSMC